MSELKRHHINEVMDMHCLTRGKMGYSFVYYADEADKVIAHHKYKRCLEMAERCNANCMHTVLLIGHKIMPHWEWRIKTNYWYKWRKIWFEISRKFKEAK